MQILIKTAAITNYIILRDEVHLSGALIRTHVKLISRAVNGNSFSLFLSAGDQLTYLLSLSLSVLPWKYNYAVSKRHGGDLFESVPTLETRFAPLSHLPRATSHLQPLVSREQVEIKAPRRASPFGCGRWDDAEETVIQRTNGEVKGNGTVYKRMSAWQCAQKTPRYLTISRKGRRGRGQSFAVRALHVGINRYRRNYSRVPSISFL